ncbi:MAG TPA: hypothetical protein VMH39_05695 [Gemmatimonadaceae bacterium]|nr:hypothetical protein [Gemmatimonadaceae bacterium]HUL50805.1 hypothetical protein [Gemmatimonadales bacterium]
MNLGGFFFMLLCFTGAAVVIVLTIAWAMGYVKRLPAKTGDVIDQETLEAIRARLAEVEHHGDRLLELEERLDFVERALSRAREPAPLRNPAEQ